MGYKKSSGLSSNTQYCFYAKAKNHGNDVRFNASNEICGTTQLINVGITDTKKAVIKIYPNQTDGLITFIYQTSNNQRLLDLDLYNSMGVHVKNLLKGVNKSEVNQQFNIQPLPNGIYFLVIRTQDQNYVLSLSVLNK